MTATDAALVPPPSPASGSPSPTCSFVSISSVLLHPLLSTARPWSGLHTTVALLRVGDPSSGRTRPVAEACTSDRASTANHRHRDEQREQLIVPRHPTHYSAILWVLSTADAARSSLCSRPPWVVVPNRRRMRWTISCCWIRYRSRRLWRRCRTDIRWIRFGPTDAQSRAGSAGVDAQREQHSVRSPSVPLCSPALPVLLAATAFLSQIYTNIASVLIAINPFKVRAGSTAQID